METDGMNKMRDILVTVLALAALASCTRELDVMQNPAGKFDPVVRFGLETDYDASMPVTKTAYSAQTVMVGSDRYERINWKTWGTDGDVIRVLSDRGVTQTGASSVDYKVVANGQTNISDIKDSEAEAMPYSGLDADNLYWENSGTDHFFFAVYPSPDYPSGSSAFTLSTDGKNATVSASIDESQSYVGRGSGAAPAGVTGTDGRKLYEYEPLMDRAYMFAAAKVAGKDVGIRKVPLRFKPLFTAFQFNFFAGDSGISGLPGDKGAEDFQIKRVRLYSDPVKGNNLSGDFSARIATPADLTGTIDQIDTLACKRDVYVDIPDAERVTLGKDTVRVTLFALPVDQMYLCVDITFIDGNGDERVRTLYLQKDADKFTDNGWYQLPAMHKLYVRAGVPDIEYVFQVTQNNTETFAKGGETKTDYYNVVSYRKIWDRKTSSERKEPWPWQAVSYYHTGKWQGAPAWLSSHADSGNGSVAGEDYDARLDANTFTVSWNSWDNATKDKAMNLGNYDIYGRSYGGWSTTSSTPFETANCYIVSAPGWYKIPAVYGNGYKNGKINHEAFTNTTPGQYLMNGAFQRIKQSGQSQIRGPWITRNVGSTVNGEPNAGDGLTFNSPWKVWEDVDGMVTVPSDQTVSSTANGYDPHYIYFYVDPDKMGNGGNAMIALANSAFSLIVWSWHIWVVPKSRLDNSFTKEVYYWRTPNRRDYYYDGYEVTLGPIIPGGSAQLGVNEMMDMNLGFVEGLPGRTCLVRFQQRSSGKTGTVYMIQDGDPDTAAAVHYQWGRKDPMWPVGNDPDNKPIYYYHQAGNYKTRVETTSSQQPSEYWGNLSYMDYAYDSDFNAAGIDKAIRNPDVFLGSEEYGGNGKFMWSRKRYDNLWDMSVTSYVSMEDEHCDHTVIKTVYDPCPPGFKVPNEYAFTAFNKVAMDEQVPGTENPSDPVYDPKDVINGLEASFYIGYGPGGTLEKEGMWLYIHPTNPDKGLMYFPAAGRRSGFNYPYGGIEKFFSEGTYWTATPFQSVEGNAYIRTFTMRRNEGWDLSYRPQCIPVYTRAATPKYQPYTGFMRSHGFQIRPVADSGDGFVFDLTGMQEGHYGWYNIWL